MDRPHYSGRHILLRRGMIRQDSIRRRLTWLKGRLRRHNCQAWDLGRSCINRHHHRRIRTMDSHPRTTISQMATRVLIFRLMQATVDTHLNHLLMVFSILVTDRLR